MHSWIASSRLLALLAVVRLHLVLGHEAEHHVDLELDVLRRRLDHAGGSSAGIDDPGTVLAGAESSGSRVVARPHPPRQREPPAPPRRQHNAASNERSITGLYNDLG